MSDATQAAAPRDELAVAQACARIALERKARDVRLLKVGDRLGIAEFFVLATVNNRRQARAVRDAVRIGLKELGFGVPDKAHEDPDGRWSLYDYGGVVMHMFDDEGRDYFDLDAVWADVPQLEIEGAAPGESGADAQPAGDAGDDAQEHGDPA